MQLTFPLGEHISNPPPNVLLPMYAHVLSMMRLSPHNVKPRNRLIIFPLFGDSKSRTGFHRMEYLGWLDNDVVESRCVMVSVRGGCGEWHNTCNNLR